MPMSFPDLDSLKDAAEVHGFRKPLDGESEDQFRAALADHVAPIDFIESQEIRHRVGWDQWGKTEKHDSLRRKGLNF
jgi:hypothetical protein